ncbi:hypothetical protein BC831DRAFT_514828 [Entophlyctis helioformis]|nr:hypothetical protein BC831DRAFT_514828 [Entophlyctis helioformis]
MSATQTDAPTDAALTAMACILLALSSPAASPVPPVPPSPSEPSIVAFQPSSHDLLVAVSDLHDRHFALSRLAAAQLRLLDRLAAVSALGRSVAERTSTAAAAETDAIDKVTTTWTHNLANMHDKQIEYRSRLAVAPSRPDAASGASTASASASSALLPSGRHAGPSLSELDARVRAAASHAASLSMQLAAFKQLPPSLTLAGVKLEALRESVRHANAERNSQWTNATGGKMSMDASMDSMDASRLDVSDGLLSTPVSPAWPSIHHSGSDPFDTSHDSREL